MSALRLSIAAAALLGVAAPLAAQVSSRDSAQVAPNAADIKKTAGAGEKVICKSYTDVGSLTSRHKVCHTQMEWEDQKTQQRHKIEQMQELGTVSG